MRDAAIALAVVYLCGVAMYLVVSSAAKAVNSTAASGALVTLGLPVPVAYIAVRASIAAEMMVVCAIVVWPRSYFSWVACLALFAVFAVAGALALSRDAKIDCGCMGMLRRSELGRTQIVQLAIVVVAVAVVPRFAPNWDVRARVATIFVLEVGAAVVLVAYLIREWVDIRMMRRSLAQTRTATRRLGWTSAVTESSARVEFQ